MERDFSGETRVRKTGKGKEKKEKKKEKKRGNMKTQKQDLREWTVSGGEKKTISRSKKTYRDCKMAP